MEARGIRDQIILSTKVCSATLLLIPLSLITRI